MLSIIIPTRDRAKMLAEAILSIYSQTYPIQRFETLVIDNGSTDNTEKSVKELQHKFKNLYYFYEPKPGLHNGRHRGLNEALGDILIYIDDDIEVYPNWLKTIDNSFSDPQIAMIGGNNIPKFLGPPPSWLIALWNRPSLKIGKSLPQLSILELPRGPSQISPLLVWGCNFSIRKSILLESGGFHPDAMPPDLLKYRGDGETCVSIYIRSKGLKCLFHPEASIYHKIPPERMTFEYFRKRGFSQGISDSYTALRGQNEIKNGIESISYTMIKRLKSYLKNLSVVSKEAKTALREIDRGHREGYKFHQNEYKRDPLLREWVHKKNYYED